MSESTTERPYESPPVPSPGVSAIPTPGAVSEKPEQNVTPEAPEGGEQDASQNVEESPEDTDDAA